MHPQRQRRGKTGRSLLLKPIEDLTPTDLAIIIPALPGEPGLPSLLETLSREAPAAELLVREGGSRAQAMNAGVEATMRPWLWFLHADSTVTSGSVDRLLTALAQRPRALHYFDLRFADDGPALVRLNQWGANLRSHLFGLPFGDQGLCLSREVFSELGGYPEDVPHGEDHHLVLRARKAGIAIVPIGMTLTTSARRYRDQGWFATTFNFQRLAIEQAFQEWRRS